MGDLWLSANKINDVQFQSRICTMGRGLVRWKWLVPKKTSPLSAGSLYNYWSVSVEHDSQHPLAVSPLVLPTASLAHLREETGPASHKHACAHTYDLTHLRRIRRYAKGRSHPISTSHTLFGSELTDRPTAGRSRPLRFQGNWFCQACAARVGRNMDPILMPLHHMEGEHTRRSRTGHKPVSTNPNETLSASFSFNPSCMT